MGQVIAFPAASTSYPGRTADLGFAERVLLNAIRWWVEAYRDDDDPIPRLHAELEAVGAHDAALPVDSLMRIVACTVRRPVDIHCPACPDLSLDEIRLLHAASLAQAGDIRLAERVLRATLLSAEGAAFAIGSLEGMGALLARARLFLTRRVPSGLVPPTPDSRESWAPPHVVP